MAPGFRLGLCSALKGPCPGGGGLSDAAAAAACDAAATAAASAAAPCSGDKIDGTTGFAGRGGRFSLLLMLGFLNSCAWKTPKKVLTVHSRGSAAGRYAPMGMNMRVPICGAVGTAG